MKRLTPVIHYTMSRISLLAFRIFAAVVVLQELNVWLTGRVFVDWLTNDIILACDWRKTGTVIAFMVLLARMLAAAHRHDEEGTEKGGGGEGP